MLLPTGPWARVALFQQFVIDGEGDFLFLIQHWSEKGISGVAYSKTFGKVGPFVALKEGKITLGNDALYPYLRGSFHKRHANASRDYEFLLDKTVGNPDLLPAFFPFRITGWGREVIYKPAYGKFGFLVNRAHYDPFTGSFFVESSVGRFTYGVMGVGTYKAFLSPPMEWRGNFFDHRSGIVEFRR